MHCTGRTIPAFLLGLAAFTGCSEGPAAPSRARFTSSLDAAFAPVETVAVPVNGGTVLSATVLEAGVTYKLRASGTFFTGLRGDSLADAEYADFSGVPASLLDACEDTIQKVDLGIGVNDAVADSIGMPFWGAFDASHVYTIDWVGAGAALSFNYHDCDYSLNTGSLSVEILAELIIPIAVDIKPDSDRNPINLGSQGVIPVAILGSEDFDVSSVDVSSLAFGPGGAGEAHGKGHPEDVNEDGIMDLMLHFRTQESGLSLGDTEICLLGVSVDSVRLEGCDSFVIVPPDKGGD